MGTAASASSAIVTIVGIDMIASAIDPVRAVRPLWVWKRLLTAGATTESPTNPITTDGIAARSSIVGFRTSRSQPGETSARNVAAASPSGTAITRAPAVTTIDPSASGTRPKTGGFLIGSQRVSVRKEPTG